MNALLLAYLIVWPVVSVVAALVLGRWLAANERPLVPVPATFEEESCRAER